MKKIIIIGFSLLVAGFFLFIQPKPKLLDGLDFSQVIYDSRHQLLRLTLTADGQYRVFTPLSAISSWMIQATLLKEDRNFYVHSGVDFPAIFSAIWQTYVRQNYRRGASTLTMQVARLRYHLNTHTVWGKLQQMMLAVELEHYYSKAQILEAYFNLAPYGSNIEGVGAASLIYYHGKPENLTLPQALTLSVIPQNPEKRGLNRGDYSWLTAARFNLFQHWIAAFPQDEKYSAVVRLPLTNFSRQQLPFLSPHFVDDILQNHHKIINSRTDIATTLDLSLQKIIEIQCSNILLRKAGKGCIMPRYY